LIADNIRKYGISLSAMTNEEAELLAGMTVGKLTNVLKTEVVQALADKVEFNIRDMLD